jgi:hypothetical protein
MLDPNYYTNNLPYAEGGMVKESKKKKKDVNNPYISLAEMIRQQGSGEDSILAHINPLEAAMLQEMGGSGTTNPITGLPQFGFFQKLFGRRGGNSAPAVAQVAPAPQVVPDWALTMFQNNPMVPGEFGNFGSKALSKPAPNALASNEEMAEKLRNQILMDQARSTNINYVPYRGETVAPISQSTIRAQNLKNEWSKKPAPYANKIATVLNREPQGFSPEQQQNLLNMLRRGSSSENMALQRMGKQFGSNYGYEPERESRLKEKIGKDMEKGLVTGRAGIQNLSDQMKAMEGNRRTNIANAFHTAGRAKEGRRNALTNQLEEFGNLEQNYRNLKNQANRDAFDEELNAPNRKMAIAGQALNAISPYVSGEREEMHPYKAAANNAQLQKITNFYNSPHLNYPGQRVVDIDAQTRAGNDLTYNTNPKYRDKFYNERKAMEKGFLGDKNLASQTYSGISEGLEPQMENLDYLTKQQLKHTTGEISGRHRRMGTYGSGVHKAETEKATRNILRRLQAEREGALAVVGKNKSRLADETEQNNLANYAQLAGHGAKEFRDILSGHKNLVNTGNMQWANRQQLENAKLGNWYDQLNHEAPIAQNLLPSIGRGNRQLNGPGNSGTKLRYLT